MRRRRSSRGSRRFKHLRQTRLFRIFRKDRAFAVIFALSAVVVGVVAVAVPPLWQTTPRDFLGPVVRVSLVDLLQARAFSREAGRAAAAGRWSEALLAWRGALAENPGDATLHRRLLLFLREVPEADPDDWEIGLSSGRWLLGLARTNSADLALAAEVLQKFDAPDMALSWLETAPNPADDALARTRARVHVAMGRYDEFRRAWEIGGAAWSADPRMVRYADAVRAAQDPGIAGAEAATRLRASLALPGSDGVETARILLGAASRQRRVEDAEAALGRLEAGRSASGADRSVYWATLAAAGRGEDVEALVSGGNGARMAPRNPRLAARYAQVLADLGYPRLAKESLTARWTELGLDVRIWRIQADLMASLGQWTELRLLASETRALTGPQSPLYAEILLAEYQTARGDGRSMEAARLAGDLVRVEAWDAEGVSRAVRALRRDGSANLGMALLTRLEDSMKTNPAFWTEWRETALALKDRAQAELATARLAQLGVAVPTGDGSAGERPGTGEPADRRDRVNGIGRRLRRARRRGRRG